MKDTVTASLGVLVSPLPSWYIKIPYFAFKTSQLPNEDNGYRNWNPFSLLLRKIKYTVFPFALAYINRQLWESGNPRRKILKEKKKSKFEIL